MSESCNVMTGSTVNLCTLTIRLIRSFEFRNWKALVLHSVPVSSTTTEELIELIRVTLLTSTIPTPFKTFNYDTLKIEYQPHGFKTNDPLINTENDEELLLKSGLTLEAQGIQNETEISFFRKSDYLEYVKTKHSNETN